MRTTYILKLQRVTMVLMECGMKNEASILKGWVHTQKIPKDEISPHYYMEGSLTNPTCLN